MAPVPPTEAHKPRVFVSYVREDHEIVDRLVRELSAYGFDVWLDKSKLAPGHRWKDAIREAISQGDFFLACFSEAYGRRSKSYMNEEIILAIEELRQRPTDRAWFIPVALSECEIPARSIGAGETLRDIHWVELHRNWDDGIASIAAAIDPNAGIDRPPRMPQLHESKWDGLIGALDGHRCTLILGSGINYGIVPGDAMLARKGARYCGLPDWTNLSFAEVAERWERLTDRWHMIDVIQKEYGYVKSPNFGLSEDVHAAVSRLPCQVFITTCLDRFMEDALIAQGKRPRSFVSGLYGGTVDRPGKDEWRFGGSVREPFVLHVYGRIDVEGSLVITTNDHLSLMRTQLWEKWPVDALSGVRDAELLWLGFNSETLEFRTLFALIREYVRGENRPYLSIEPEQKNERSILLRDFMAELVGHARHAGRNPGQGRRRVGTIVRGC